MQRYDAIKKIVETVDDEFIVSNIGFPSRELFGIKDRKKIECEKNIHTPSLFI